MSIPVQLQPFDEYNQALQSNVHPTDWTNPTPAGEYHLVVAGVIICALEVWMVAEAIKLWPRIKGVLETDLPPLPRGFPVAAVEGVNPQSDGGRSC